MSHIVHQPPTAAIRQSPAAESEIPDAREPADTRYDWIGAEWENSPAPRDASWRLEGIERALHATRGIQKLLARDHRGRSLQSATPEELYHDGLDNDEVEALHAAMDLVLFGAVVEMERLRVDEEAWTGPRRKS